MGASEAGGGRRDRSGQARLVGAGEANGGRNPPGQIPSQQHIPTGNEIFEDTYQNRLKRGVGVITSGTVLSSTGFLEIPLEICTATTPGTTTGAGFDCIAETIVARSFGAMLGVGVAVLPVRWQILRWEAG